MSQSLNYTGSAGTYRPIANQFPREPCYELGTDTEVPVNSTQVFEVTFTGVPTALRPPYNISQTIKFRNETWVQDPDGLPTQQYLTNCNLLQGMEQINETSFQYTGHPVYNETVFAMTGNFTPISFGFTLIASGPVRYQSDGEPAYDQPFWRSDNYTIMDAMTDASAGGGGGGVGGAGNGTGGNTTQPGGSLAEHAPPVKTVLGLLTLLSASLALT